MSKHSPRRHKQSLPTDAQVSVVIVSYNNQPIVFDCLDSLRQIDGLRVYVVDNISSAEFLAELRQRFPEVELIHNDDNVGFSRANNQALKLVSTPYVLVLNSDTTVPPHTIGQAVAYLDSHPEVGVLGCRVELANGRLDKACRRSFPTPWVAFTRYSGLDKLFPHSSLMARYNLTYLPEDQTYEVDSIVGAFMLIRTQAMNKVGLFDETYFMYGEDIDWCYRFWQGGWKIVYYPAVKILHYKGMSSGIVKHSTRMSQATLAGRRKTTAAFYNAMKIFYNKHYQQRYPAVLRWLVFATISIKQQLADLNVRLSYWRSQWLQSSP